jgi:hypothetical protein
MTPLGIFGKKDKEKDKDKKKIGLPKQHVQQSLLEKLCEGNKELYNALSRTLLLDIETTKSQGDIDARATVAQEYEKNKDNIRARVEYRTAGELALYEGKTAVAQKFFKKAAEIDPAYEHKDIFEFFAKKENAEKAVAVAREYYAQTAKAPHERGLES